MIDFVNTLDTLNDEVLSDRLIDRSISGAYNDDKITTIGQSAFAYCKKLTSVCFPVATKIGQGAFRESGLKAITPETFPFVTSLDYQPYVGMFAGSALESVEWPSLVVVRESAMFNNCASLKRISLPNYVDNGGYLGLLGLSNCTSLTDVNLPAATNCPLFKESTALETITLPSVKTVGESSFLRCSKLRVVDLPSCTEIDGTYTFENCSLLEALILRSTTMCTLTKDNWFFVNSGVAKGEGYIYVPKALVDSYKAGTNWSNYAAQFRAIEDYPDICGG